MNLSEWTKLTGILPTTPTTERGAVSVLSESNSSHHTELWKLNDYSVSTVSGPIVWLIPKPKKTYHLKVRTKGNTWIRWHSKDYDTLDEAFRHIRGVLDYHTDIRLIEEWHHS